MPDNERSCQNCQWWIRINSLIGECRRMPPHPADNVEDPRWWPTTKREDWCGEFRTNDQKLIGGEK